ncbi:MAG: 23S rRNA (guanosine-2'-O-)-methyltransferase RlmB [Acidimicrobiales bacterium]|nr:MAG: RNA methyltransferase [Actinomycetota bacterium]MBV6507101.1 23S rRNA (guanosine-2'-O-)-methyltransferase RlmB [Acidimicrobiales bacterium]RIK05596.1 MAG: hypothetical protein DCC48_09965 [Acidobacteriota bacterium]
MQNLLTAKSRGVQRLRRLARRRSSRLEENAFVLEGAKLVDQALASSADLEAIYVAVPDDEQLGESLRRLTERAVTQGVPVNWLAPGVLESATTTVTAQAVAAIARRCERGIGEVVADADPGAPLLVLVELQDPGNAGTLLRSAAAAGAAGALLCGDSVDLFNPKLVRASAGAIFQLPVAQGGSPEEALGVVASAGRRRLGMTVAGGTPYDQADLTGRIAIVLGNESHGFPQGVEREVDEMLSIPMVGGTESLNVGVAGAVALFEALRQRRHEAG